MYTTRNKMPNEWPINRKGTKYIATTSHAKNNSISLLFVIRNILKIANTRKEVKDILMHSGIFVSGKAIKNEKFPVQIDDIIHIPGINKNFKLILENGLFKITEISEKEASKKIVKVIGKNKIGKNKMQINLRDGQNMILSSKDLAVGDSVIINNKDKKLEKIISLKEGVHVDIIGGKYAGSKGTLSKIKTMERGKRYIVKVGGKDLDLKMDLIKAIE